MDEWIDAISGIEANNTYIVLKGNRSFSKVKVLFSETQTLDFENVHLGTSQVLSANLVQQTTVASLPH